jgi:hypothetical protein
MIEQKLSIFLAPSKKNPQRLLAILIDGTYPWYLTKTSTAQSIAQEIFDVFELNKFNILLNDLTKHLISNQFTFNHLTLSKRKSHSNFTFTITSKFKVKENDYTRILLTRIKLTKKKVTIFLDDNPLSIPNISTLSETPDVKSLTEIKEFIELFRRLS